MAWTPPANWPTDFIPTQAFLEAQIRDNLLFLYGSAWIVPALSSGWQNFGGGHHWAAYKKVGTRVFLRGLIRFGPDNSTIFTLPLGYRPTAIELFYGAGSGGVVRVDVNPDGTVVAYNGGGTFLSLAGLSFDTV